ncbi:MAG: hypothetical protein ABSC93_18375, partial [Bryobacteraceae bacterium]
SAFRRPLKTMLAAHLPPLLAEARPQRHPLVLLCPYCPFVILPRDGAARLIELRILPRFSGLLLRAFAPVAAIGHASANRSSMVMLSPV